MKYIAHSSLERDTEQSIIDHLTNTAELAAGFAAEFGANEVGYLCGMLHDIGKYSDKFQRRIRGSSEKADHSTAGALEARKLNNIPVAFCVSGHHAGLPDGGNRADTPDEPTFFGKISRIVGRDIENYEAYKSEVTISGAKTPTEFMNDKLSAFFFVRMLYSCLVDADFLDTEKFMRGGVERTIGESIETLTNKLDKYTASLQNPKNELNKKRCEILNAVTEKSGCKRGLFTLTVPTGGGKTVTSMSFALNHAQIKGQRRVIYVIPYVSIIEQTQKVFEEIFGKENVIAHYANVDYKTGENDGYEDKHYLAAENWDAPIILTTSVQFFESLYSNRPSRCRKLHNIANSVIIFDEAQMFPVPLLIPCVSAISQLIEHYGCSAVLCTATQPALNRLFEDYCPKFKAQELCPDVSGMYEFFRRVTYINEGGLSDEQLAAKLNEESQVLCIVNNRKQAQDIFSMLDKDGGFHLSTTMYPLHRRRILSEIHEKLRNNEPCRVISTSLIEAGVDVDFPTVYRALAGLDSMIQAGGRCNREGRRPANESVVHLFESERKAPGIMQQNIAAGERVMRRFEDISSVEAVRDYFEFLLYKLKDKTALDAKKILSEIKIGSMPFATVASRFRIIESSEFTVYVPLGEGAELVEKVKRFGVNRGRMRRLGQYAVGVYPNHFKDLISLGAVERLTENTAVLCDLSLYDENTGLSFGVNEGVGFFI